MFLFSLRRSLWLVSLAVSLTSCAYNIGPGPLAVQPFSRKPVVAIGEVSETLTGTWSSFSNAGFRTAMGKSLDRPEFASYFSDHAPLILNVHLTSDHDDDWPRALPLAAMSGMTFGLFPLTFDSHWTVQCEAVVLDEKGMTVAQYSAQETGTYHICTFPWTPVSLFFAMLRGRHDSQTVAKKTTFNLVAKLVKSIDEDYSRLAQKVKWEVAPAPGGTVSSETNSIV